MSEEHPLNPMSPYASAKCGADRLVYSYWATYHIPAIIVRPFNNYGPYQHLEKAIPRFVTSCLLEEPLRVHGDGAAMRDWLFVDEHCAALDRLLHADGALTIGQVFNVGTGEHKSILEVAHAVLDLMQPAKGSIEFIGDRPGQVFRHTCDASKIASVVGWKPSLSFAEGLERTVRWYTDHESWWRPHVWMRQIPIVTAAGTKELH
jgi:dTDP-glucose 4,6-dehydratase